MMIVIQVLKPNRLIKKKLVLRVDWRRWRNEDSEIYVSLVHCEKVPEECSSCHLFWLITCKERESCS